MRDKTRLRKALREAGATAWQWRAASILLAVNGIDNALEYAKGLPKINQAQEDPKPKQLRLPW